MKSRHAATGKDSAVFMPCVGAYPLWLVGRGRLPRCIPGQITRSCAMSLCGRVQLVFAVFAGATRPHRESIR
eukprot:6203715-Pleurochrysis_carterae.AAC.3